MMALADLARLFRFDIPRSLPSQDAYTLWADSYRAEPHNPLMEIEQSVVIPMLEAAAPRCALDVGTGTGRYLPLLAGAGAHVVVGMDLSWAMLTHGSRQTPLLRGDAARLPFGDARFDLVCSSLMAGDLPDLGPWIREAARVLEPGGHLVYSDFHPSWKAERWRRTFRTAGGQLCEVPFTPHRLEDHLEQLEGAALAVRTVREPRLAERPAPVVVIIHAVKRGVRPAPRNRLESPNQQARA